MSFLRNLFGKEQPIAAASDSSPGVSVTAPGLSETASPIASRVHRVVNEMCAKPGRSFSKQAHAAPLYELLIASQIPKNVADLFVEATTFTAAFTGARTDESRNALQKLCGIQGPVVDNLLHCLTQLSDADHTVDVLDARGPAVVVSSSQTSKVSFEVQREMAQAELKRRGSPKYDASRYAIAGTPALRLCDPVHLARKELDWVAMIVDQSVSVEMAGDRTAMKVSAPADQLGKALSKLEHSIARCPDDPDLLVAKACILTAAARPEAVGEVLDLALSRDSTHFESLTWKNHPATWANALRFPKWDKKSSSFHPVMAAHLALGHRVQVVRNGLQKTLAIVAQVQGPPFDPRTQVKVEWRLSETPKGPLVAYYLKIIEPTGEPSVMEAFLPGFQPTLFSPLEGYFLVQQLAFTPYCFVVLVSGNDVILNRRIIFEDQAVQQVRDVASRLASAQSYLPEDQFQSAMQWHMNNFDVKTLAFD